MDGQVRCRDGTYERYSERGHGGWHPVPMPDEIEADDSLIVIYRKGCPHSSQAKNAAERVDPEAKLVPVDGSGDYNARQARLQEALNLYPAVPKHHTTFPAILLMKGGDSGRALYIGDNSAFQTFVKRM